jgi:hypothetical protein
MATPRQQGLLAEARALLATAPDANDQSITLEAQSIYNDTTSYLSAALGTQWLYTSPQDRMDALAQKIMAALNTSVSPLDLDTAVNLSPDGLTQGQLSDSEKDILSGSGGNWGAAAADGAAAAASAAGAGIKKLIYLAVGLAVAYFIFIEWEKRRG